MLDFIDSTEEDKVEVEEIIDDLREQYKNISVREIDFSFNNFEYLAQYFKITPLKTINIGHRKENTFVSFVQSKTTINPGRHGSGIASELQAYVIVELPTSFGHLVIKEETIKDKIIELFQPLELDFKDDASFSRKFYVLAKDKEKANRLINPRFRNLLKTQEDKSFFIEVRQNIMLIGNMKGAADGSLLNLIKLGNDIAEFY